MIAICSLHAINRKYWSQGVPANNCKGCHLESLDVTPGIRQSLFSLFLPSGRYMYQCSQGNDIVQKIGSCCLLLGHS